MIACSECLVRCYPSNPQVDGGCKYWCDKPETYRQLETQPPQEHVIVHRTSNMSKQDWDLLQQTARRAEYLEKEITKLKAEKRKGGDYEPF